MMNNAPETQEFENPWRDRSALPTVELKYRVVAAIACFVCALAIPMAFDALVAPFLTAALFAAVVFFARTRKNLLLPLISAVILSLLFGVSGAAIFLAAVLGTALTAYLITVQPRGYACAVLPLLALAAAYLWTRDFWISLLALSFLPAAILLAVATLAGKRRTTAICFALGGWLITALVMLAVVLYRIYGKLDAEVIQTSIDALRAWFVQQMMPLREIFAAMQEVEADAQNEWIGELYRLAATPEAWNQLVTQVFQILLGVTPALIAVCCSIIAFEAQSFLNATYQRTGLSDVLTLEATAFTMSVTAAVLYGLSFLLTLTVPESSMASVVMQNLSLMLMPGFCVIGVRDIAQAFARARGNTRVLLILLFAAFFCCGASGSILYLLAMWGAYGTLTRMLRRKLMDKMQDANQ